MIKIYADEHIDKSVVLSLRNRGIDIITVQEVGMRGKSDLEQLKFASNQKRAVLTADSDFLKLKNK